LLHLSEIVEGDFNWPATIIFLVTFRCEQSISEIGTSFPRQAVAVVFDPADGGQNVII